MQTAYYVYTHSVVLRNGTKRPFYVGKGKGRRATTMDVSRNAHHKNIVQKYGKENLSVDFWATNLTEEQALQNEVELIAFMRGEGLRLANVTDGGEGTSGYHWTEEQKTKKSGASHPMFGKECPEERRLRTSATLLKGYAENKYKSNTGRKADKATRAKQAAGIKASWTEERKQAYSDRMRGTGNHFYGRKHSAEAIAINAAAAKVKGSAHPMFGKKGALNPKYGKPAKNRGYVWVNDGATRRVVSLEVATVLLLTGWKRGRK